MARFDFHVATMTGDVDGARWISPHELSLWIHFVACAFSLQACAPVITHGPEVRSGFTGGATTALGKGPRYENGDDPGPFYFGATMVNVGYGVRPTSNSRPALRIGVQAPTVGAAAADLYVQAPRRWLGPVSAGVGILSDFAEGRQMPYIQAGAKNRDGFGLDVAIGRYSDDFTTSTYIVHERAQVNWLSFEAPLAKYVSVYFRGGFASGHVTKLFLRDVTPYRDERRWVRLGGASIELHR